jgi:hypothetical protein
MPVETAGLAGQRRWVCEARILFNDEGVASDVVLGDCPPTFHLATRSAAMEWRIAPPAAGQASLDTQFVYRLGSEPAATAYPVALTVALPGMDLVVDVVDVLDATGHAAAPTTGPGAPVPAGYTLLTPQTIEVKRRVMPETPPFEAWDVVPDAAPGSDFSKDLLCEFRLLIDPEGRVESVQPGPCPEPFLAAGVKSAAKWRFKPWPDKEEPVPVIFDLTLRWVTK